MSKKLIVIGNIASAFKVIARIKVNNPDISIVLYDKNAQQDPFLSEKLPGITVKDYHELSKILPNKKELIIKDLNSGNMFLDKYDFLVLATGLKAVMPNISGINNSYIVSLFKEEDIDNLKKIAGTVKKAVVIGSDFTSLEAINILAEFKLDITLICYCKSLVSEFDDDINYHIEKECKANGIKIITDEKLMRLDTDNSGKMKKVVTDQSEIEADLVVICPCYTPDTDIAEEAGLIKGKMGGIVINNNFETIIDSIYAVGDCAENDCMSCIKPRYGHIFQLNIGKAGLSENELANAKIDYETVIVTGKDKSAYYPDSEKITLKLLADKKSRRLIGMQAFGYGDIIKRINNANMAMISGLTIDQLENIDLAYAPPFSSAIDTFITTIYVMKHKLEGQIETIMPEDMKSKLLKDIKDFVLVDVRTKETYEEGHIKGSVNIPLDTLLSKMSKMDREKEIITNCNMGDNGYMAFCKLRNSGFKKARFLQGGITAWPGDLECTKKS